MHFYTRKELEDFAQSLQAHVDNGVSQALRLSLEDSTQFIPREVLQEIQQWLQKNSSSLLWVEGPVFPADLSPTALRVWGVVSAANIPCTSFFNQNRYNDPQNLGQMQAGAICLLYTLITQLIYQLPSVIEAEKKLGEDEFAKLNGSWESQISAMEILRHLLSYAPPSLVIIIHGLEGIESKATQIVLGHLVDVFREQSTKSVVKVLLTTNGMCHVLGKKTGHHERVNAERMSQGRAGYQLPESGHLIELKHTSSFE